MVRQWQEFFYERRYAATPLINPDFAKIAQAYGLTGLSVSERSEVVPAVEAADRIEAPSSSISGGAGKTPCISMVRLARTSMR